MADIRLKIVPVEQTRLNLQIDNLSDKERSMLYELGNWHDNVSHEFFNMVADRSYSFNERELSHFLLELYHALQYGGK